MGVGEGLSLCQEGAQEAGGDEGWTKTSAEALATCRDQFSKLVGLGMKL